MRHQAYNWVTSDGIPLFGQSWSPASSARAVICLVHGIGEHSSRYKVWVKRFVQDGIAVVSFDQRGHGLSGGRRGVIPSYDSLLDDLDLLLSKSIELFPGIPMIFYGHSMGGGEVLSHLLRRGGRYKAAIVTSPWIIAQASPGEFLVGLARLLAKLWPNLTLPSRLDAGLLSHDAEVVRAYKEDVWVHQKVSLRLFLEGYDAGKWVLTHAEKIKTPLLLMHGDADRITSWEASQDFARGCEEFCHLKIWEGAFHELHHELIKDEVFVYIKSWLEENVFVE